MLRSRTSRREESLAAHVPEPAAKSARIDLEQEALLADSVGLALLVVLDRLSPAERRAFVLHDMFALPFEEIAPIVGRSTAARQLASRARAGRQPRSEMRRWAKQALAFSRGTRFARPVLVNGAVGAIVAPGGRLFRVLMFTIARGKIAEIDVVGDPARLRELDFGVLNR
jgi:Sigma-70, region 4